MVSNDWGFWVILQYCLAMRGWLNCSVFLIPTPPISLGWQIVSQAMVCNFLTSAVFPYQRSLMILSILLHVSFDNLWINVEYIGMTCITNLIRVSFPADDKCLPFQVWSLLYSRLMIWLPISLLVVPGSIGIPKYFTIFATMFAFNFLAKSSFIASSQLGLTTMTDLVPFIFWPDTSQKLWRVWLSLSVVWLATLKKMIMSSTNMRCEIGGAPIYSGLFFFFFFFDDYL